MSVRVRFAPSPTGYLHIGGARTALYNYLYAKAVGGTFVLRIEDTDLERSKKEYEELQISDLKWLGIDYDEGPDRPNEKYGPYRQSERLDIYQKYAQDLVDRGLAYYDFCSDDELEQMKERAQKEGRPPHYDGKWKNPAFHEEAMAKLAAGEKGAIRFRVPEKSYVLNDKVKNRVVYPEGMVGDFVIMRSNGLPVYNFCCVIDDMTMEISHVIRGEDHLSNTVRQLMVYEAFGKEPPVFAHVSLLIGKDRQKLSKRHGATAVNLYREDNYLPEAMVNYLCLLGWSHPEELDIFNLTDLKEVFNLERFSTSAAIYDLVKLKWVNGQHLRKLPHDDLIKRIESSCEGDHFFKKQSESWKEACCSLLKQQIEFVSEFLPLVDDLILSEAFEKTEKLAEIMSWETTPQIIEFLKGDLSKVEKEYLAEEDFSSWMTTIKKELGVKGKPLFMGVRASLTGKDHGPELKDLIPLTPVSVLKKRVESLC